MLINGDNRKQVTEKRLETFNLLVKRTIDLLKDQISDGTLASIKSKEALTQFNKDIESIVISKFISKFNLQ